MNFLSVVRCSLRGSLPLMLACLAAALPLHQASAVDGDLDPTFASDLLSKDTSGPQVISLTMQPDGNFLTLGLYKVTGSSTNVVQKRMLLEGATDPGFIPTTATNSKTRFCALVQLDRKILTGGATTLNSTPLPSLVRFNSDGSVDATYTPAALSNSPSSVTAVENMLQQPDGKVVILGIFNGVGGNPHSEIARLNANGSEDTTFNPVFLDTGSGLSVATIARQADGRLLVGGRFTSVNGTARGNFARLNSDGTLDPLNVATETDTLVSAILIQGDGKIVVGGTFTTVTVGSTMSNHAGLFRLTATGDLDTGFTPPAISGQVNAITQQIDGKLFVCARSCVRLNTNGSLDSSFAPAAVVQSTGIDSVLSLSQQFDGRILLGRAIDPSTGPGLNRTALVRLTNGATNQSLAVQSTSVQWLRFGPLPEVSDTTFQLSTDGGASWTTLGAGARIAGGWEITGLNLPSSGIVRVVSHSVLGGSYGSAGGLLGYQQPYDFNSSLIAVEQPANRSVANGGNRDFGKQPIGQATYFTFIIHNYGLADLTGLGITISGPDASQFVVTQFPSAPLSGPSGTTTFTVRFQPTSAGAKSALLSIANNTTGNNPFQISLVGLAQSDGTPNPIYPSLAVGPDTVVAIAGAAVQPDGKVLIVGRFTSVGGYPRSNIARFNADGTVDGAFNPGAGELNACGAQPDGKLLIAGGSLSSGYVARLNADGSIDPTFTQAAFDNTVSCLALQADGRILVSGFGKLIGAARTGIVRLNADGSIDNTFVDPGLADNANPQAIELQDDGKIILGIPTGADEGVLRLNSDGTRDNSFTVPFLPVYSCVIQTDGKILAGGFHGLARLNPDGSLDSAFNPSADNKVDALVLQADGRILAAGMFGTIGGASRSRLARLNADGSADAAFIANASGPQAEGVACTANGQLLVQGNMQTINGVAVPTITQLYNTVGTSNLSATSPSRVQWLRGGTVGEAAWTRFELSTDGGTTWAPLGRGTRISGGWELTGLNLPTSGGIIRGSALTKGVEGRASNLGGSSFSSVQDTASFALPATQLQTWRALQGLPQDGSQDLANPSGDSLANLLKFAFNLAPNAGDLAKANYQFLAANGTAGLPLITRDAQGHLVIQFVRRKAAGNPGITYTVETAADLSSLQALDLSGASIISIDGTWERVTVTDPTVTPRRFGRVRIGLGP